MDIEGIKIENSKELTPGQLEKSLSLIKILPKSTFLTKKEGNKKGESVYMKADELNIEYSSEQRPFLYISSRNKYFGKSIGSISAPNGSTGVHVTKKGVAFTFNECRYIVRF